MMIKICWVILIIVSSYRAAGQASAACQVYTTTEASDTWMATTRRLPLGQQLAAVRQRLACDAGVRGHTFETSVCLSCVSAEGRRAYQATQEKQRLAEAADTRPRGITLYYVLDGRPLAAAELANLQQVLSKKVVKELTLLDASSAAAIGGTRAADGMVVITTKKFRPLSKN